MCESAGEEVDPELPVELAAGGAAGVVKEEGMMRWFLLPRSHQQWLLHEQGECPLLPV